MHIKQIRKVAGHFGFEQQKLTAYFKIFAVNSYKTIREEHTAITCSDLTCLMRTLQHTILLL